jgi:hypothetical protein
VIFGVLAILVGFPFSVLAEWAGWDRSPPPVWASLVVGVPLLALGVVWLLSIPLGGMMMLKDRIESDIRHEHIGRLWANRQQTPMPPFGEDLNRELDDPLDDA